MERLKLNLAEILFNGTGYKSKLSIATVYYASIQLSSVPKSHMQNTLVIVLEIS